MGDSLNFKISVRRCRAFLLEKIYNTDVQSIEDLAKRAGIVPSNGGTPFSSRKALYIDTSLKKIRRTNKEPEVLSMGLFQ